MNRNHAIVVIVGAVASACADGTDAGKTRESSHSLDEGSLAQRIESVLPEWDNSINKVPPGSEATSLTARSVRNLNRRFGWLSKRSFHDLGTRGNGRHVFKSDDGAVQKYNLGRGYWKFIGQGTLPNPAAAVGMDIVKEHAHELESAFRIPHNQRGTEVTTSVRSTAQQGTSHVIAHHVRLLRTINGLRVWDSHFMLTAGLDGTPFRVEHRWPTFRLDESRLVADAEDVAQRFAELLGDGFQDAGLRAQLVYYFDEASGYHEPVAMLEATRESVPTPEIASISLTTGTIGQLGGKTSEEADDGDE